MNRSSFLPIFALIAVAIGYLSVPSAHADDSSAPVVILKTSLGEIDIQLDPKNAPISTANFLAYVKSGFYDGTIFHRIIPGFVVQGGGFTPDMTQKDTQPPIKNEASNGLKNLRGTISMARTNDPDSATSQFFLNLVDNAALDPNDNSAGYAVFGKITKGLDVIDKMAQVQTTTKGPFENVPVDNVTLVSAKVK